MKSIRLHFSQIAGALSIATVAALLAGCATPGDSGPPSLKRAFKKDFMVGVALNQRQFTERDTNGAALAKAQFNSISPENVLKWEVVHPRDGTNGYDFGPGDEYVNFGVSNKMYIVGHTLVWHSQTPRWVFQTADGRPLSGTNAQDRALLLQRMHDHIQTVVGHYKGRIQVWDVVNEALNDSPNASDTNMLRQSSPWVRILGEEFIVKAFEYAREADPKAILRYNDYSIENSPKRKRLIALIKSLQAQHVQVMAIGSQTHANLIWPTPELEDEALTDIAKLGLPIHITELDVNGTAAGQRNQSADVSQNAQATGGTGAAPIGSVAEKLAKQYGDLFNAFVKHRKEVKLVTFWGVTDADSWRRQGNPLLFDGKWQPKPAYKAVVEVAEGGHKNSQ